MGQAVAVIPKATRPTTETSRTVPAVGLCREIVARGMVVVAVRVEEEEDGRSEGLAQAAWAAAMETPTTQERRP